MKKFLLVLLFLLIVFGGIVLYNNYKNTELAKLVVEEDFIDVDKLFIYGDHLNLHGNLVDDNNLELVLYNGKFLVFEINNSEDGFNLDDSVNKGIRLDDIPVGKYFMFLRSSNTNDKGDIFYKYYILNNTTIYKETIFYTFSNYNQIELRK